MILSITFMWYFFVCYTFLKYIFNFLPNFFLIFLLRCKSFLYILEQNLRETYVLQIFSPSMDLPFHFLNVFWRTGVCNFDKIQMINLFSFCILRYLFLTQIDKIFFQKFYNFSFMFRPMIHFKILLGIVQGRRWGFLHMAIQLIQQNLLKRLFLQDTPLHICQKSVCLYVQIYFWTSYSFLLACLFSCHYHTVMIIIAL